MPYMGNTTRKASDIRRFDVTSSTSATHTLTWIAPNEQSLIVTINGVKQHEDSYSTSGAVLTLTSALIATDKLEVIGINDIGTTITPAQNSVDADKLSSSVNAEITANTAKVTNATHTGDVTGATALTIATDAVDIAMLSATGTASATTFLRGDNAWAAPPSGLNLITSATNNSAVASWNFGDCFSATYRVYLVTISALAVASAQEIRLKIGVSNLSTVEDFRWVMWETATSGSTTYRNGEPLGYIDLNNTGGAGEPVSCYLYIYNPFSSVEATQVIGKSMYYHTSGGTYSMGDIGAMAPSAASSPSLQLQCSSGNLGSTSYTSRVSIYGLGES